MSNLSDKILKTTVITGVCLSVVPSMIFQSQNIASKLSNKIKTEEQAYIILNQEAKKLDISHTIKLIISEKNVYSNLGIRGFAAQDSLQSEYLIGINKKDLDRIILRHELYHLYSVGSNLPKYSTSESGTLLYFQNIVNSKDRKIGYDMDVFVKYEAPAFIYAVTGIKLNNKKE